MKQLLSVIGGVLFGIYIMSQGMAALQGPDPIHLELSLEDRQGVVLFSTHTCGYCKKARRFLDDRGVGYTEYFIDDSEYAYEQFKSLGGSGVPLLVIGDEIVEGYHPAAISEALASR